MNTEELPSWVAFPAAACAPEEGALGVGAGRNLLESVVGYVGFVCLATALEEEPCTRAVSGLLEVGWPEALRRLPRGDDPGVCEAVALLDEGSTDALRYAQAAWALLSISPQIARWRLCHARSLRPDGQRLELRYRVLAGTGWPRVSVHHLDHHVPLVEGELFLWDGADRWVPVPRWLGWYDDCKALLRILCGPDGRGGYTYRSTHPAAAALHLPNLPAGAPLPHPLPDVDEPGATTEELSLDELASAGLLARTQDLRTVVKVISGRSMLAYRELHGDRPVVVGRSPGQAELVIHHPKVSRRNTQIWSDRGTLWVRDLGSTNGTRLRGELVGTDPVPIELLDVLQIGPALIRIDQVGTFELERIDRILRFPTEPGRDPLTGLLEVEPFVGTLRHHERPLVGLVLEIDQLQAIEADRGREIAEMVWVNVARLVLLELDDPSLCATLGFGELVAVAPDGDGAALADLLQDAVTAHAWVPPLDVTITAAVIATEGDESLEAWLDRGRQLAFLGRARRGPGRVHGVGRG